MSAINFHTKEISVKIVYYGPGLCGKTTSLQTIYKSLPESERPRLVSLATDVDRTIFFDFLPLTAYRIRDFKVRVQLYTVPGQVFYNATRKLVLNGVDGIVFVADSQRAMLDSNLESLQNLADNLAELGLDLAQIPMVMQFNKRDLTDILPVEDLDRRLNPRQLPVFATVATTGEGLFEALKAVSQLVVNDLIRKGLGEQLRRSDPESRAPVPAAQPKESFATVEEAVRESTDSSLWPAGETARLGAQVLAALEQRRFAHAILAAQALLEHEARQWAEVEGRYTPDALATFLFLRGVSAGRYRAFLQSLVSARAGKPIQRSAALNALVLALEVLW
ncbi:MAG: GTPase [Deltaproteobacteria bacterium]|nr:GTPase [Deltaproteobacteria bacterium]